MVAVHALRATEIAVGVVHLAFPLLAVGIGSAPYAALGLFNGNVERPDLHMPFLVIAGFFLGFGGLCVYIGRGFFYLCRYRFFRFFLLRFRGFANFACRNGGLTVGGCGQNAITLVRRLQSPFRYGITRLLRFGLGGRFFFIRIPFAEYASTIYIPIRPVARQFYKKSVVMLTRNLKQVGNTSACSALTHFNVIFVIVFGNIRNKIFDRGEALFFYLRPVICFYMCKPISAAVFVLIANTQFNWCGGQTAFIAHFAERCRAIR